MAQPHSAAGAEVVGASLFLPQQAAPSCKPAALTQRSGWVARLVLQPDIHVLLHRRLQALQKRLAAPRRLLAARALALALAGRPARLALAARGARLAGLGGGGGLLGGRLRRARVHDVAAAALVRGGQVCILAAPRVVAGQEPVVELRRVPRRGMSRSRRVRDVSAWIATGDPSGHGPQLAREACTGAPIHSLPLPAPTATHACWSLQAHSQPAT